VAAVAAGQNPLELLRLPVPPAYLDQRAGDVADHLVKKTVALNADAAQVAILGHLAAIDRSDGVFSRLGRGCEPAKIVPAAQPPPGIPHGLDVERPPVMVNLLVQFDRADGPDVEAIFVGLADGRPGGVEIPTHPARRAYRDIAGQL